MTAYTSPRTTDVPVHHAATGVMFRPRAEEEEGWRRRAGRLAFGICAGLLAAFGAGADAGAGEKSARPDYQELQGPALMTKLRGDLPSPMLNTRLDAIQEIGRRGADANLLAHYGLLDGLKAVAGDPTEFDRLRSEALRALIALRDQGVVIADLPDMLLGMVHPLLTVDARIGIERKREIARQYNMRVGIDALNLLYRMAAEEDMKMTAGLSKRVFDGLVKIWNHKDKTDDPLRPPNALLGRIIEVMGALADPAAPTNAGSLKKQVLLPFLKKAKKTADEEALVPGVLAALRNFFLRVPVNPRAVAGFYAETPKVLDELLASHPAPAAADQEDTGLAVRLGVLDVLAVMAAKNPGLFADTRDRAGHSLDTVGVMKRIKAQLTESLHLSRSDVEIRALVGVFIYAIDQNMIETLLKEAVPRTDGRPQMHPVTLKAINDALFGSLRPMRILLPTLAANRAKERESTLKVINDIGQHYVVLLISDGAPLSFRLEAAKYLGFWPQEFPGDYVVEALVATLLKTDNADLRKEIDQSLQYLTNERFVLVNPETLEEAGVDVEGWRHWWEARKGAAAGSE